MDVIVSFWSPERAKVRGRLQSPKARRRFLLPTDLPWRQENECVGGLRKIERNREIKFCGGTTLPEPSVPRRSAQNCDRSETKPGFFGA